MAKIRIFTQGLLEFDVVGENDDSIFYSGPGYGNRGLSKADKGATWDYVPEQLEMFEEPVETVEEVMDMANEETVVVPDETPEEPTGPVSGEGE